jgi:uncharacterized protein with HEPN domain
MKPSATSDRELIEHMLDCIARIREYTRGQRSTFFGSRMVQDAVVRNLHTLTESSQRLSDDVKRAEPGIAWRQMSGMRNILVHDYLGGIDLATVWAAVERNLPELEKGLERQRLRLAQERGGEDAS